MAIGVSAINQAGSILTASHKYNVPLDILVGVYGKETEFGALNQTSRTGAIGAFQFEPGTAPKYNYPLTNNPTKEQFAQQADAAAHLLADNFKQAGNWDGALNLYNSGRIGSGYGQAEVLAKAKQAPSSLTQYLKMGLFNVNTAPTTFSNVVSAPGNLLATPFKAAGDVGQAVGRIADLLTSGQFWLRVGEAILGVLLLIMGLRSLTGMSNDPLSMIPGRA